MFNQQKVVFFFPKAKQELTPRPRVKAMVRNERVSDKIKRQLVFGGALTDQIKVACKESKSKKLRRAVKKIVFGEVTKMYKCFSRIRKDIGLGENPKK